MLNRGLDDPTMASSRQRRTTTAHQSSLAASSAVSSALHTQQTNQTLAINMSFFENSNNSSISDKSIGSDEDA